MNEFIKNRILLFLFLIFCFIGTKAQITKIRGTVKDSITSEPLPFVNISFKNSSIGTVTNTDGVFFFETRTPTDSIIISFVGYQTQSRSIQKNIYQEFQVLLSPQSVYLDEIVVLPTENPAHAILRNIIANKKNNNPKKFDSYTYELYNKVEIDINNVDDKLKSNRFLKDFQFIFDFVDTNAITGKTYLPIFITESFSKYYYNRLPRIEREIITATKISGVEDESLSQFTGKMYQKINIYENFETVFEPGFVSPIADFGLLYYKYYLLDSAFIGNQWCYQISFLPKRTMERVFRGDFWVHDTTFAIKRIQMRMAKDVNINYINDFVAEYEFEQLDDSVWFLSQENLFFDFNITDRSTGFFGRKTTHYMNISYNNELPPEITLLNDNVIVNENALIKDNLYWEEKRPYDLTPREKDIYKMVDSIQQVPIYKTYERIAGMFVMYHYELGYFELGPYYKTFSFNEIEGNRFRLSARTSNQFSTKLMISGFVAYGEKDNRFKYGGGLLYIFNKNPRRAFAVDYKYDMQQLGQSPFALTEDNFFTSILRRNPNYKISLVTDFNTYYEHEWFQGFSNKISFNHKRIEPTQYIPFQKIYGADTISTGDLKTSELTFNIRLAKNEKYLRGEFERLNLGTDQPILNIFLTAGLKNVFQSDYEYYKISANLSHKIPISPLGYFKYIIDAGQVFGIVPYPYLKLHEGNETYAFDKYAFNMMNYYEFASDRYISLYAEHHFQGFFLNKIPLLKKLELREVVSGKCLIGELSNKHQKVMLYPEGLYSLSKPYYEVSAGIENILKILRVDAMWRLSYLDHENIDKFGLRVTLQIVF
ncbi:MAG: hypothetical protein A2W99_06255 [Bacteroidetes bacterium GWF2_33_16]|nr:MAG: hypothetical protein A2X00_12640 [Bacteroidetes bacterium GWE2_32_14]OFY05283.1 MAG: hypothetical protein A2W99_06255 [Bacteroidetes bacterium GWF2_33_16]